MSVDKFGRHGDNLHFRKVRGPPGEGFSLTAKGHYDMKNKLVRNMGEPTAGKDGVTLHYLRKNCMLLGENKTIDCGNRTLKNIGNPESANDAISLGYIDGSLRILRKEIEDKFIRLESLIFKHIHENRGDSGGNYENS